MPGPGSTAKRKAHSFLVHPRRKALRVHFFRRRSKNQVYPVGFAEPAICRKGAWIAGEIFLRPELGRVYENARDDGPFRTCQFPGTVDQCCVTCMKCAHGRDEHEGAGCLSTDALSRGDGTEDFQGVV